MTFHNPIHEGMPLEVKSEAEGLDEGNVPEAVAAALEGIRADVVARLEALETKSAAVEKRLARPAILSGATVETKAADQAEIETKAFEGFLRTGMVETKALTVAAPGTGGVIAPPTFSANVIQKLVQFSPVRSVAQTISMGGNLLEIPRLVDEVQPGMVGETDTRPESEPSLEQISIKPFEMAVIVAVSKSLLEDSNVNISAFVSGHVAKKFGQKEARQFVVGNGTTEAEGVLTSADLSSVPTAAAGKIGADDIMDLYASIPSFYASRGAFLMNRQTISAVRKLKNTIGDYLWQESLADGSPGTLLGRPVLEAPDCPDIASGATPIVFGDFSEGYLIADRVGLEFQIDALTGWNTGVTKFLARRRVGGRVILPEALSKLKVA